MVCVGLTQNKTPDTSVTVWCERCSVTPQVINGALVVFCLNYQVKLFSLSVFSSSLHGINVKKQT